jgi:hypothetical protein
MKKELTLVFLFFLVLAINLSAQEPQSFRSKALGGIINDDLDLVYDPINLRFVDTLHLYTNLSNLTSGYEKVFHNYVLSDNELLLGASRQNPFYKGHWISALFKFKKTKAPQQVSVSRDLTGDPDVYADGDLETEFTEYYDALFPFNGLYDLKRIISQKESYNVLESGHSFILNNSFLISDFTIGLQLVMGTSSKEWNNSSSDLGHRSFPFIGMNYYDPSFTRTVEEFYLDSNYTYAKWSENGEFNTTFESPIFRTILSAMKPFKDYELRGDILYYPIDIKNTTTDSYNASSQYFQPSITNYSKQYSETDRSDYKYNREGSGFGFGVSARRTFNKQLYRKNDGFVSLGAEIRFESFDHSSQRSETFNSYENINDDSLFETDFEETINEKYETTENGPGSANIYFLNAKFNIPLVHGVHFGIGASYLMNFTEINTDFSESLNNSDLYARLDTFQTLNYSETQTFSQNADKKKEIDYSLLTIPVGIEYCFTEDLDWAIRFGAVFQYITNSYKEAIEIKDSKPFTTRRIEGDGTDITYYDPNRYLSTSRNSSSAESLTYFTYGLGWTPTQNLQVDLLGFFDVQNNVTLLEYFKNLRLSFVMKF